MTITSIIRGLFKFFSGSESHANNRFTDENEYLNSTEDLNLVLAAEALSSYARNGKTKLVNQIIQIFKIPMSNKLIEQLLNNTDDYTANNVVDLYNLSHLPYIENKDIHIKILSHICNKIIPKMDCSELDNLKNKGLICFTHAITQQEYFLLGDNINEVKAEVSPEARIDTAKLSGEIDKDFFMMSHE